MKELEKLQEAKESLMSLIRKGEEDAAEKAIAEMLSAQAQSDVEAVELCVPTKSITKKVDLGPIEFLTSPQGVLFRAKGSMSTYIDRRQASLCSLLEEIMGEMEKQEQNKPIESDAEAFAQAWCFVLQAPLFCSIDPNIAINTATLLLKLYNKWTDKNLVPVLETAQTTESAEQDAQAVDFINSLSE